jgi:sulfide:quinone oxidoreductase
MAQFCRVTPTFSVAAQISADDIARAAAEGFRAIIINRPDGEEPGQPLTSDMKAAAEALGLSFHVEPFSGAPPPAVVAETAEILDAAPGPVLAYCRTGRRSIMAWAMATALGGHSTPDEIIAAAKGAGYDLEGVREALRALSPKP